MKSHGWGKAKVKLAAAKSFGALKVGIRNLDSILYVTQSFWRILSKKRSIQVLFQKIILILM